MLNKFDLQREVNSLDMLISVLSSEIVCEPGYGTQSASPNKLLREMQEALYQLRQERGLRKILLMALENSYDIEVYKRQSAMRRNRILGRTSALQV